MTTTTQTQPVNSQDKIATTIRIYNTLSKQKEPLEPVEPGKVGIYLCGPTVYDKAHIGHMVGPVIFDCIKRYLEFSGYDVTWVVNITDVDDKLINKATERGITMADVAAENTADYLGNLAALGVDTIDHFPKATDHMDEIIAFTQSLIEKGFAYASDGDVYFEVGKDGQYGKLSNRSLENMQGEGGGMASRKRSPGDFALWKSAKPDEPSWESPWGPGRPGWHIECSAMSRRLLGETFDIHGGGLDLVFPHHENEIAQSECCHSKPMAKYWMHNGLMQAAAQGGKVGGRSNHQADAEDQVSGKISRSKGAGGLADLIGRQGGERIRLFLLRTHYRSTIVFGEDGIEEAATGLETFYRFFKRYQRVTGKSFYDLEAPATRFQSDLAGDQEGVLGTLSGRRDRFLSAMDDDFNSGGAIAELFEIARTLNKYCDDANLEGDGGQDEAQVAILTQGATVLRELSATLGIFCKPLETDSGDDSQRIAGLMKLVIDIRTQARANKNFATADQIRDGLTAAGITLEDRAGGTEWEQDAAATDVLASLMTLLIDIRASSRENKDFQTADQVRDELTTLGVTLEDRPGGTDWSQG